MRPSVFDPAPRAVDRRGRRGLASTGIMSRVILPPGRSRRSMGSGDVAGAIIAVLLCGLIVAGLGWFAVGLF